MADRETKRINAKFLTPVIVGDIVVNAERQTLFIPRYRVMAVSHSTVRLGGINTTLDFIVRVTPNAIRTTFIRVEESK